MPKRCWCGNEHVEQFRADYDRCPVCDTLIAHAADGSAAPQSAQELADFYGMDYWLSHQEELQNPDVYARARYDLSERCLFWLRALLRYKLPPAGVLELGSSHGGFVYLLRQAGYRATGLEINPAVVEMARAIFDIPVLLGPVEEQAIAPASLDAIVMMDVLEHLPDPLATVRHCLSLLKPDGILVVQTPCYPQGYSLDDLNNEAHAFRKMLLPREHLFLFSQKSAALLFERLGVNNLSFAPAIFDVHDMFFVAGKSPLTPLVGEQSVEPLARQPQGRLVQAALDVYERLEKNDGAWRARFAEAQAAWETRVTELETDRAARLEQINSLSRQLETEKEAVAYYQGLARSWPVRFAIRLVKSRYWKRFAR